MLYTGATEAQQAKLELLEYLIGVAQNTQGAEVWRALLAEMRGVILATIKSKQ